MKYEITGKTVPVVEIALDKDEAVYTQSGKMAWQTEGLKMNTNAKGGLLQSLGRMVTGESLFMSTFTSEKDGAKIAFASTVPGDILPVEINSSKNLMIQKKAFLCATPGVEVKIALSKKFSAGLVGGEGFVLQKVLGEGTLFMEVDGDPIVKELADGEVIKVSTGNVVAFDENVKYEVETVKGFSNLLFGGEGLFLTRLVGPGKVVLQSQNFYDFAGEICRLMPSKND